MGVGRKLLFTVTWLAYMTALLWGALCLGVFRLVSWVPLRLLRAAGLVSDPPHVYRTPDSRFNVCAKHGFSYEPKYLTVSNNYRMHFVDEGDSKAAETVLCLHGEPSWSFLYRDIIPPLVENGYRVIAPDFIGFGRSDKPTNMDRYTHEMHTSCLREFIVRLNLRNVTLVVQDWGGLTGLSVVKEKEITSRISRLVIMNTGLPGDAKLRNLCSNLFFNFQAFLAWRTTVAVFGRFLPYSWAVKMGTRHPMKPSLLECYAAPFPNWHATAGAAKWPLLVPMFSWMHVATDMARTREFLRSWKKPTKVMFSDRDPITRGGEQWFLASIPGARDFEFVCIRDAGHFLQEDKGIEIAQRIVEFIEASRTYKYTK